MSPKITPAKALNIDNCFKSSKFIVLTPPPNPLPQGRGKILCRSGSTIAIEPDTNFILLKYILLKPYMLQHKAMLDR